MSDADQTETRAESPSTHGTSHAPIALFVFNRPAHTVNALRALAACDGAAESDLVIFSDAPRGERDARLVHAVRDVIAKASGFRSVECVLRPTNMGAALSVIDGVNAMFARSDRAIFMEDDLICAPSALAFLNHCLERYADLPTVFAASAYNYPQPFGRAVTRYRHDAYFSRGFFSWGWATWRRTLKSVDWSVSDYDRFLADRNAVRAFGRAGGDLPKLLALQQKGVLDDWVLPFTFSQFKQNAVTVRPVYSLIDNNGHDGSGLHCANTELFHTNISRAKTEFAFPDFIYVDDRIEMLNKAFHSNKPAYRVLRRIADTYLKLRRPVRSTDSLNSIRASATP
jgi:hypothetical protein